MKKVLVLFGFLMITVSNIFATPSECSDHASDNASLPISIIRQAIHQSKQAS